MCKNFLVASVFFAGLFLSSSSDAGSCRWNLSLVKVRDVVSTSWRAWRALRLAQRDDYRGRGGLQRAFSNAGAFTDDSRNAQAKIFVAFSGEKSDGHQYVEQALKKGAIAVFVEKDNSHFLKLPEAVRGDPRVVPVENNIETFRNLAIEKRKTLPSDLPIIAVGGSNGKTGTTGHLGNFLEAKFGVAATNVTRNSTNGDRGGPRQMNSLSPAHKVVVFEVGTDAPGQMRAKLQMVEPKHAILTSIGPEHMSEFKTLQKVLDEELEVCRVAIKNGGKCFLPSLDYAFNNIDYDAHGWDQAALLKEYQSFLDENKSNITQVGADITQQFSKNSAEGVRAAQLLQHWPEHHQVNLSLSVAAARELGVSPREIVEVLESSVQRTEFHNRGMFPLRVEGASNVQILNATYNANEGSMRAGMAYALKLIESDETVKKPVFVLGDMLDLGADSVVQHKSALRYLFTRKIEKSPVELVLIGSEMKKAYSELRAETKESSRSSDPAIDWENVNEKFQLKFFGNSGEAQQAVENLPRENAFLYFQGSNGTKVGGVVETYIDHFSPYVHHSDPESRHLSRHIEKEFEELQSILSKLDSIKLADDAWVHITGGAGKGTGNLAVILESLGYRVTISEVQQPKPPMSDVVGHLPLKHPYSAENLSPNSWKGQHNFTQEAPDLVIVGNAIGRDNPEFLKTQELSAAGKTQFISFPEAIYKFVASQKETLDVAGTHGKSTTTTLMAHAAEVLGNDQPSYLIGGAPIGKDSGAQIVPGKGIFIIEGDEYNTANWLRKYSKFLFYNSDWVTISGGIEFDHADIFRNITDINRQFELLSRTTKSGFVLVDGVNSKGVRSKETKNIENLAKAAQKQNKKVVRFGFSSDSDYMISQMKPRLVTRSDGKEVPGTEFTLTYKNPETAETEVHRFEIPMMGEHNILNTVATVATMHQSGRVSNLAANQEWMSSFRGLRQRFELLAQNERESIYSDFAHHPAAYEAALGALRTQMPDREVVAMVEFFSSTSASNKQFDEKVKSLAKADVIFLRQVNRKTTGEPLDVARLANELRQEHGKTVFVAKDGDEVFQQYQKWKESRAKEAPPLVSTILSNGHFDGLAQKLQSLDD